MTITNSRSPAFALTASFSALLAAASALYLAPSERRISSDESSIHQVSRKLNLPNKIDIEKENKKIFTLINDCVSEDAKSRLDQLELRLFGDSSSLTSDPYFAKILETMFKLKVYGKMTDEQLIKLLDLAIVVDSNLCFNFFNSRRDILCGVNIALNLFHRDVIRQEEFNELMKITGLLKYDKNYSINMMSTLDLKQGFISWLAEVLPEIFERESISKAQQEYIGAQFDKDPILGLIEISKINSLRGKQITAAMPAQTEAQSLLPYVPLRSPYRLVSYKKSTD